MSPSDLPPSSEQPTRGGLAPGIRLFDRFVLRGMLGRGGMSVVWEAHDERLGEAVALKVLPDTLRWDPAALEGLRRETQRARSLAHPNIVRVYDLHEGPDGAAIAMERVQGRTLSAWRVEQPGGIASPAAILPWMPALCQALDYAHREAGIVHRDLKPANIMLTADGRVKVADFGIACAAAESLARTSTVWSGGTLPYMSPQQLWGEPATAADDLYALGAVLFELLTGEPPFARGHLYAQIERRVPARVNVARRARAADAAPVPRAWEETVARCLAKDPAARPASAAAVLEALLGKAPPPAGVAGSRPARRALLLGGVALVLAAGLGWPLARRGARASAPAPAEAPASAARHLPIVAGALGQRLVAHLPLDGDLRVHGGRRGYAAGGGLDWTTDRFGRARAALQVRGSGGFTLPLEGRILGDATEPWTLACWIRSEVADGGIAGLIPSAAGRAHLGLSVGHGTAGATTGPYASDTTFVRDSDPLEAGWHHLAVALGGGQVTLWRDGRRVGSEPVGAVAATADSFRLEVGAVPGSWSGRWRGAIDDVRIYAAALGDEAVASLAAEDAPPGESWVAGPGWTYPWRGDGRQTVALTLGTYTDAEDAAEAVRREFGPGAAVADWADLGAAAGPWPELLAEMLGWCPNDAVYLTRGGERGFAPGAYRPYYAIRTAGVVSTTFLQHARLGRNELSLGSWGGQTLPILARVPNAGLHGVVAWEPRAAAPEGWSLGPGAIRAGTARAARRRAWIAVASLPELGRLPEGIAWDLADDAGQAWRAAWVPADPGVWGLEIARTAGDGEVASLVRHEEATGMQSLDLVVVITRGRAYAAVVDPANARWIVSVVSKDVMIDPRRAWTARLRAPALPEGAPVTRLEWVEFPAVNR